MFKLSLGRFGFPEFVIGVIQNLPYPEVSASDREDLECLVRQAWSLRRVLSITDETSHAFWLPAALKNRVLDNDHCMIEFDIASIQTKIDTIACRLYGINCDEFAAILSDDGATLGDEVDLDRVADDDADDEEQAAPIDHSAGLLSWTIGVAFGRFDWRLATGERAVPPEPDPFDPLPAKSPGMLPDDAAPFHHHAGILTDDPGHPNDLPALMEAVLTRVQAPVPADIRRWLQRDFFPFHLQRYSKSRRKAPIYWPLATSSGSYTLWLY